LKRKTLLLDPFSGHQKNLTKIDLFEANIELMERKVDWDDLDKKRQLL